MHYLILDPTWKPSFGAVSENVMPVKTFNFPAGESHVKLEPWPTNPGTRVQPWDVAVCHRIRNGDDAMRVLLAADAVRSKYWNAPLAAYLPYLPYARQDRVMVGGEPFSLNVFIKLLATVGYKELMVLDPHNPDLTSALCAAYGIRLSEMQSHLLQRTISELPGVSDARDCVDMSRIVLVSPDAGASKKIAKQAEEIRYTGPIFQGDKARDLHTGKITHYEVYGPLEQLQGKTAIIRDDICSKGGTFKLLAKALKEKGVAKVMLVVSHWEGTADVGTLKEAGIDHVYTTNSLPAENTFLWNKDTGKQESFVTQFPL